eukprot:1290337-Rhodomonas_salina.7
MGCRFVSAVSRWIRALKCETKEFPKEFPHDSLTLQLDRRRQCCLSIVVGLHDPAHPGFTGLHLNPELGVLQIVGVKQPLDERPVLVVDGEVKDVIALRIPCGKVGVLLKEKPSYDR